jgi:hypothetical protein
LSLATNSLMIHLSNSEKYRLGWDILHVCTLCVMCRKYVFPPYSLITKASATPVSDSWVRLVNTNQATFFECECSLNEYNNALSLHSNLLFNPTWMLLTGMPLKCECASRIQAIVALSLIVEQNSVDSMSRCAQGTQHCLLAIFPSPSPKFHRIRTYINLHWEKHWGGGPTASHTPLTPALRLGVG